MEKRVEEQDERGLVGGAPHKVHVQPRTALAPIPPLPPRLLLKRPLQDALVCHPAPPSTVTHLSLPAAPAFTPPRPP